MGIASGDELYWPITAFRGEQFFHIWTSLPVMSLISQSRRPFSLTLLSDQLFTTI